ncbi:MAG: tetratricopeptide repeat protein, partial [Chitinophagaceae bacterium]|nr:tetratricopeptide repeat protein [Anaerolineae bacterium]
AENAITAFEEFVALEPQSAVGWANLAGLRWQVGRQAEAIAAMENAVEAAPLSWQLWFNLGSFREMAGDLEGAREAYENALPAATIIYPAWQETELRREIAQRTALSDDAQMAECIIEAYTNRTTVDEPTADLWWVSREKATTANTIIYMMAISLIYEPPPADYFEDLIVEAAALSQTDEDRAWIRLGRGWLARYEGDEAVALSEFANAQALIAPGIGRQDYVNGVNFGYALTLRYIVPRQFLPQVYYPTANPLLVYLLENSS